MLLLKSVHIVNEVHADLSAIIQIGDGVHMYSLSDFKDYSNHTNNTPYDAESFSAYKSIYPLRLTSVSETYFMWLFYSRTRQDQGDFRDEIISFNFNLWNCKPRISIDKDIYIYNSNQVN